MANTARRWDIYADCVNDATQVGHHSLKFWGHLIDGLDDGSLDLDAARGLIDRWKSGTDPSHTGRVSRATAYRMIAAWRPVVVDLRNPGRGV